MGLVLLVLFALFIEAPWEKISIKNVLTMNKLTIPKPKVKTDVTYGVRPIKGDQCWAIPECAPYDRPPREFWHGITIFHNNKK